MKKIILMVGAGLAFFTGVASAQIQTRPVTTSAPLAPGLNTISPVPNTVNGSNTNGTINTMPNSNINMNNVDQNSTQPGVNQPGNRVLTPPDPNPVHDNTMSNNPVIYSTPVQAPQTVPAPATSQPNTSTPINPVLGR